MFTDVQNPRVAGMEEVQETILREIGFNKLRREFREAQILPAYYMCGVYSIRITSHNETYLAVLDSEMKRRLSKFCNSHQVALGDGEEIHKEENRFTKEYTITAHS